MKEGQNLTSFHFKNGLDDMHLNMGHWPSNPTILSCCIFTQTENTAIAVLPNINMINDIMFILKWDKV